MCYRVQLWPSEKKEVEPREEVESKRGGDGSQVLRVHRRFATAGMRKLFEAADEHRAASLGEFCQLDWSGVAVPSCGERKSQWGV